MYTNLIDEIFDTDAISLSIFAKLLSESTYYINFNLYYSDEDSELANMVFFADNNTTVSDVVSVYEN